MKMNVSLVLFFLPQWVQHRHRENFAPIYRVFGIVSLLLPVLILPNWGYISYLTWDASTIERFYQVGGFVLSALLIWTGLRRHWPEVVNTGVTFFVILLYTKFYDCWWDSPRCCSCSSLDACGRWNKSGRWHEELDKTAYADCRHCADIAH